MKMKLEADVENKIMYIPVADETDGGTPILKSKGLKIAPPPRPRAPDTQPPKNANITSLVTVFPSNVISLSHIPISYFNLRACSYLNILIYLNVNNPQSIIKTI